MIPFKRIFKNITAIALSVCVSASLLTVYADEPSGYSDEIPFLVEAHAAEVTVSDGYMSAPIPITPSPANAQRTTFSLRSQTLPEKFDLRDLGCVTSAKDQKNLSVCWAFSGISNFESYVLRHMNPDAEPDFSENHLRFSMSRYASDGNWLWGDDRYPDAGGNFIRTTSYFARGSGPVDDSSDPYQNDSSLRRSIAQLKAENGIKENLPIDIGSGNYLASANREYTLSDTTILAMTTDRNTNVDKIKRAIYEDNAVDMSIHWDTANYVNGSSIYCDVPILTPNHEVNIVGWDDDYPASKFKKTPTRTYTVTDASGNRTTQTYGGTVPETDGAFLIKNSWGADAGDDGYYWMSYCDMIFSRPDATACYISGVTQNKYDNIHQYDPLLMNGWVTPQDSQTCRAAAVYPAKYGEEVCAVGFYTLEENCTYKVRIATNETSLNSSPVVAEGYLPNAGYHMIEFDGVTVKGVDFAAIVDITCLDEGIYPRIALEFPHTEINSNASANAKETFISYDSSLTIYDTTKFIVGLTTASACIKAFTNDPVPDSGLSGYVSYSTSGNNGNAVFNLANNSGSEQTALCVTAVYNGDVLENAFVAEKTVSSGYTAESVPFEVSSSACTVKSMIFYKDSLKPVMPVATLHQSEYNVSEPQFADSKIFLKPGESKCINVIDSGNDVTSKCRFISANNDVFEVKNGVITAGNTPGYAKITGVCGVGLGVRTFTAEVYVIY